MELTPLMVAIDIDGTLLSDNSEVSLHNIEKIKEASDMGIKVVLSTGRPYTSAAFIADKAGLDDEIIAYNGAMIASRKKGILYHKTIPWSSAIDIIEFARRKNVLTLLFIKDRIYAEKSHPWNSHYEKVTGINVDEVECFEMTAHFGQPTNILLTADEDQLQIIRKEFSELPISSEVKMLKSTNVILDIVHRDASKGNAIDFLARQNNIPLSRIAAIGDNENDIDMLNCCSISIAMGNSPSIVKQCCRYITLSNNESGVAHAFSTYILKNG